MSFYLSMLTTRAQEYSFPFDKSQFQEIATLYVNANRFIPGERILYQIENNLVSGEPSFVSKIAYIELVDASRQSVLKSKVELDQGRGDGYLYIPSFVKTGQYTLIAYTSWMLNYSKSFIPQLGVQIINPFNPVPASLLSDSVSIAFFPEGGTYVLNQPMKVAYRLSWKGKSTELNIKIVGSSGEEVSSFVHDHSSPYGHFNFTPTHATSYKVIIVDQEENIYYDQFLVEASSQLGIQVAEGEDTFEITAFNRSGSPANLKLLSWPKPQQKKSFLIHADTVFSIQANSLPEGLSYLYYEGTAVGRFINGNVAVTASSIRVNADKEQYNTREMVSVRPALNENLSDLFISVRKVYDTAFTNAYSSNLWHQLINQDIETPESQSDFLICNINPVLQSESESIEVLPDYRGQLLYGQVQDFVSENNGDVVFLSSIGQAPMLRTSEIQDDGHFLLLGPDSYRGEDLVAFSGNGKSITISEPFLNDFSFIRGDFHFDRTDLLPWLQEKAIHVQIENNYFEFNRDSILESKPRNWLAQKIDKTYDFDDYTRFPTVTEVIVEIVPELRLRERNNRLELIMPYIESKSGATDSVLILIDGVPVVTGEFVKLNPLQFKKVDLIFQQLRMGYAEYRGVAMFTSLSKNAAMVTELSGYTKVYLLPMQDKVKHFQPNYDTITSTMPDFRSQLLWKTNLDLSEVDEIKFYTSDLAGKFEIVLQGRDKKGNYFLSKAHFNVGN